MRKSATLSGEKFTTMTEKIDTASILQVGSALILATLLPGCSSIDAVSYDAPKAPAMTGVMSPNQELTHAKLIAEGKIPSPETVTPDDKGNIYSGSAKDGKIWKISVRPGEPEKVTLFADPGGSTLGHRFDAAGNLIVCNKGLGLLSIAPDGKVTTLTNQVDGKPIGYADDLDIAKDGKIYFSDATDKFVKGDSMVASGFDMLEARPHGRLLVYDPVDKSTKVLLDGLYFANGVTLSCKQDYVLVNETFRYRVARYWLKGPKKGQRDLLIDNLPGAPDGIRTSSNCTFWVALPAKRSDLVDNLHKQPGVKNFVSTLPASWWLKADPYGLVIEVDEDGKILKSLHDPTGRIYMISNATQKDDNLYIGCIRGSSVAVYQLPHTK
jgi:sugar lactone lactonase YvrE